MIKTQFVIAPYQCDPDTWVMRVAWLHNRLVAHMNLDPCIVVSQHANILAGCFGDDEIEEQRRHGLRSTLLHVAHTAMGVGNELFVITLDDGNTTEGLASQLRVWMETRNDFEYDMNIYAGTWQHWLNEFKSDYDPIPTPEQQNEQVADQDDESSEDFI